MKRAALAWAIALPAVAMLVPIAQFIVGIPIVGHDAAHDGPFAIFNLTQFRAELMAGHLLPRWASIGNGGLGSPIFFFYPPGAYYLASLLGFAAPALADAAVIDLAQVLFRAAAMLSCFLWLRRRTSTEAAVTGGALYALMPWVSVFNPQIRLDFAECAATALFPLAFLAVDQARGRTTKFVLCISAIVCALTLVHVTTTVAMGGLMVIYAAFSAPDWRTSLRDTIVAAAAIALGLGLAGFYLLPALSLLPAISTSALWDPGHQPEGHFMLARYTFRSKLGLFNNICLLAPCLLVASVCGGAILKRRVPLGVFVTFAVAVFLTVPLSAPVWAILSPLRMVQFPGRFLVPVSLFAAALTALVLPSAGTSRRSVAHAAGLCLGSVAIVFVIWFGDGMSGGAMRTRQAVADPSANAPEYVPAEAGARGWLYFGQHGGDMRARADTFLSGCVTTAAAPDPATTDRLAFNVERCGGPTIFPQFYFPGWVATAGGQVLPVTFDPASGLILAEIPPGSKIATLRRVWLPVERLGVAASGVSLALWLLCLTFTTPAARRR